MLIEEYRPEWSQYFHSIKATIKSVLIGQNIRIEHIGSTAVPGLAAKPVIDIDIVYPPEIEFNHIKDQLAKIGYFHNGNQGILERDVFKRKESTDKHAILDEIKHHLYACPIHSEELHRHLLFRDFLRENVWARKEYQTLKYAIAEETNQDRKAYAYLKMEKARELISSILAMAEKQLKEG